ncbi:MAG TPA: DUF4169 family protein [Alphaproteobacteria bacterium]|jgi:hypothetical protein
MGEVIRFSKAKKRLRGLVEERTAAENRTKFGRSKAQKSKEALEREKMNEALDQAKRDDGE